MSRHWTKNDYTLVFFLFVYKSCEQVMFLQATVYKQHECGCKNKKMVVETILQPEESRFVMFPIKYHQVGRLCPN